MKISWLSGLLVTHANIQSICSAERDSRSIRKFYLLFFHSNSANFIECHERNCGHTVYEFVFAMANRSHTIYNLIQCDFIHPPRPFRPRFFVPILSKTILLTLERKDEYSKCTLRECGNWVSWQVLNQHVIEHILIGGKA